MAQPHQLELAKSQAVRSQLALAKAILRGSNSEKIARLRVIALMAKNHLTMLIAAAGKREKS